jgi:hypothetical protein
MVRVPGAAGIAALAAILTAIMAAPVLVEPTARLFGTEIVGRHHDPYTVIAQFERPPALSLYSQPATDLAGAALARIIGGAAAYNVIVLASFPLAALFTWMLVHRVTRSAAAAAVAALAFAFSVFHVAQSAYHPHVAQVQWIPLYLLALWLCLDRFTAARAICLAVAAALVALSNFYGGFIAAVMTPVAVGAFALTSKREPGARPLSSISLTVLVLMGLAFAGLAYVRVVAPQVIANPDDLGFPAVDLTQYGARWWAYLLPSVEHPLAGSWARRVVDAGGVRDGLLEQQLGVGLSLLALAAIAVGARSWRWSRLTDAVPALVLIGAAAFICSLAPGQRIGGLELWTPAALLHDVVPIFRSYARFAVVVALAVSGLAGIGFAVLVAAPRRWQRLCGYSLAAIACVELAVFPPWRWHHVLPTEGHRWAATLPPGVRILDLGPPTVPEQTLPILMRRDLAFLTPGLTEITDPGLAPTLASLGFTHAIYRRPSAASRWLEAAPLEGFRVLEDFADSVVLEVTAARPAVTTRWAGGFYARERSAAGTWQWMGERGSWAVTNQTGGPRAMTLELEAEAFPARREFDVVLNGERIATLEATPRRSWHRVGPLTLRAGANTLMFRATTPPVAADTILGNGDPRALSLAIWDWKWTDEPPRLPLPTSPGARPSSD